MSRLPQFVLALLVAIPGVLWAEDADRRNYRHCLSGYSTCNCAIADYKNAMTLGTDRDLTDRARQRLWELGAEF